MLLEEAMAELRQEAADGTAEGPALPGFSYSGSPQSPLFFSKASSPDEFSSSSNTGSSSSFCDDSGHSQEGVSLLQDDNAFVSRVLNRAPSNLGESSRFGSYRSTAAVAAGGVPFRWEAEPGKSKNPAAIPEEDDEAVAPLCLPPARLSAIASPAPAAPHLSPSSSAAPSPRSLTGKVKSLLVNHVKKPSTDHFIFSTVLDSQKSPRGRRASSLTASDHASLSSMPDAINVQRNDDHSTHRTSLNSSDHSSSPYYFSPLSNTSSSVSQSITSPRASLCQSLSGSVAPHIPDMRSSQTSASASGSPTSSSSSQAGAPAMSAPALLANCLLRLTDMSNDTSPPSLTESADSDDHRNGNDSLSFAYPEMEILNDGLLPGPKFLINVEQEAPLGTTIAEFISRGGPSMNRSSSTSRVTFADDLHRMPMQKSMYYSAQLSNLAEPRTNSVSPKKNSTQFKSKLDVLFPLKKPHVMENLAAKFSEQYEVSSEDRQAYVDALDTSLDCSVMTDNEELNSMVQSIMKEHSRKERPAHEVVIHANDNETDYAYSPIASAFVFSPSKISQSGPLRFFMPSAKANIMTASIIGGMKDQHYKSESDQPKSILKKPYSHELTRAQSLKVNGAAEAILPTVVPQSRSLSHTSSQKISSVLLRFAESEEHLYQSKKQRHHQNAMRSPACMQPMCSFLGRALLCRPKLARHAGHLHA